MKSSWIWGEPWIAGREEETETGKRPWDRQRRDGMQPQAGGPLPPAEACKLRTSSTATVSAEPAPSATGSGTLTERAGGRATRSEAAVS